MSNNVMCGKGFLIKYNPTTKQYTPFFIQVRNKDIRWDNKNTSVIQEISKTLSGTINTSVTKPSLISNLSIKDNDEYIDFICQLDENNYCSLNGKVYLNTMNITENSSQMYKVINLPFSIKNNNNILVHTTNHFILNEDEITPPIEFSSSVSSICLKENYSDNKITQITVILSNPIYLFSNSVFKDKDSNGKDNIKNKYFIEVSIQGEMAT